MPELLKASGPEPRVGKAHDLCVVQLGRHGDVLNILPALHHLKHVCGSDVCLLTCPEFAETAKLCSWLPVYTFNVSYSRVRRACRYAPAYARGVVASQVYGDHYPARTCSSFCLDSWARLGMEHLYDQAFDSLDWRKVFDLFTVERAKASHQRFTAWLVDKGEELSDRRVPVLVCGGGYSSPTPWWSAFVQNLQAYTRRWAKVIDVSDYKAESFVDMLGVLGGFPRAVIADTGLLHLAAYLQIPTVALVADRPQGGEHDPWYGTPFRSHMIGRLGYGELVSYGAPGLEGEVVPPRFDVDGLRSVERALLDGVA